MNGNNAIPNLPKKNNWKYTISFAIAIIAGIINGIYFTDIGLEVANFLSNIFVRLFKFVSIPIIGVTICVTLAKLGSSELSKSLWKKTLFYTITTTVLAASVAAGLYLLFTPENVIANSETAVTGLADKKNYLDYFLSVIPDNPLSPLVQGNVLSILIIAIAVGIAIRLIPDGSEKEIVIKFISGIQTVLFQIIKWIIAVLPFGIFGFITICVHEFSHGVNQEGIGTYFGIIIGSNLLQGLVVLPLLLLINKINPIKHIIGMFKALLVAFFSKSSAGTLPITISCAENELGMNKNVTRFVFPICTTINMNGCAAFILTTVVYLMQNNGVAITPGILALWIVIATIAAIGNAGVPMGCFFLSASLLASMDVPIVLLGIILPVYAVLDMIETALNVFSDSCVAAVVNKKLANKLPSEA